MRCLPIGQVLWSPKISVDGLSSYLWQRRNQRGGSFASAERLHKPNRRPVNLRQLATPRSAIKALEVSFIVVSELTLSSVVHNREWSVSTKDLTRPRSFTDLSKEMSKSE